MSSSGVFLCLDEVCGRGMRLPFVSPKFSHQTVSTMQTPLYYTVTRYIPFEVYFLMISNQNRITPGRRLPEATRSTLHHYFITSYTVIYSSSTNSYWSNAKPRLNSPLQFLLMVLNLLAAKRLPSFFFAPKNLDSVRIVGTLLTDLHSFIAKLLRIIESI